MKHWLIIAAITLSSSVFAAQANWTVVSNTSERVTYIDTNSIVKYKGTVDVWIRHWHIVLQKTNTGQVYRESRNFAHYTCKTRTGYVAYTALYTNSGGPLTVYNTFDTPTPIMPGTVEATIVDLVCKK